MPAFKAKARAVDLLGKGQIADLPTAICELWKNGYDAYADNATCCLYLPGYKELKNPVFVVSDDGKGMSETDILNKWIVLGTDSKIKYDEVPPTEERLNKEYRIPMGEKGIGRLAVAYLGPIMLMFTKKKGQECNVLFVDWRILDNYNLYLDEVNIPLTQISSIKEVETATKKLIGLFLNNLKFGNWIEHSTLREEICKEISSLIIPKDIEEDLFTTFFDKECHGTHFVIFQPNEQLMGITKTGSDSSDTVLNYIRSSLTGITNNFKADSQIFQTDFIVKSEYKRSVMDKENFFERSDFQLCDHYCVGEFDETGFFIGKLRIFNKEINHSFRPNRKPGIVPYGPFKIEFGTNEGAQNNTQLSKDTWLQFEKKFVRFGGLYIFRDNFRVLPYGRPETDWLGFEERRSRSAGYYTFSHRRMFGYIEISRIANRNLKDKAGREGLIQNTAYRELVNDLIEFFIDLSVSYFRKVQEDDLKRGKEQTLRIQLIEERNKVKALEEDNKRNKLLLQEFANQLNSYSSKLKLYWVKVKEFESIFDQMTVDEASNTSTFSLLSSNYQSFRKEFKDLKLAPSKRVEMTDKMKNDYYDYLIGYRTINDILEVLDSKLVDIQSEIMEISRLEKEYQQRKHHFDEHVEHLITTYKEDLKKSIFNNFNNQFTEDILKFKKEYQKALINLPTKIDDKNHFSEYISKLDSIQQEIIFEITSRYEPFIKHVKSLDLDIDEDFIVGYYKKEYEDVNKKIDAVNEIAQLGMAIEILDHQFNVLYSEISQSIKHFKQFADRDPDLKDNYLQLRNAFEHLETNYQLLAPLYRTMRRNKVEMSGKLIKEYLMRFFSKKLLENNISITSESEFDNYVFYSYESVIKPAFINIINNAIYWLQSSEERKIHLSVKNDEVLIINSGKKIPYSDLEQIFNLFFTRKPNGRGIGLYLAKTNLNTVGFDIYATNDEKYNIFDGACFVIKKLKRS